ncbi:hypothetical protein F0562_009135 [Nyssa sinensis]|uniref:Peptidase A1 domain-containing protein n=1 Tax=Nyssa sinensis TaxID=561372 RepID=A0A5J4ZV46_9ASTE|nr:hypothetical protein F0562_009135 [Nyssa sinensis]
MEDASALVHHELFLLFICFTSLVFSSIAVTATATIPYRLNIKLIHRDSILSPYYSPNATTSDRFRQAIENSMARFAYLKARTSKTKDVHVHVRGPLIPRDGGSTFLVIFFIGEPPVPQLLMMDTGGNLLWVQCLPCTKCLRQFSTIFDPSNSSTYANLPCNSPLCLSSIGAHCNPEGLCLYLVKYEDGTGSIGNLATEKLTFMTSDDGITNVPNMVFGCGHNNVGKLGQPSGILGLNSHKTSLISQLGSRFSYCIGNIFDPHYNYNQLIIGDGEKIEGYTTPMAVYNDFYYLTLEGISVGEKLLDIDPETFRRTPSGKGGVIIDSGTTISFLARGGYQALSVEVQNLMDGVLKRSGQSQETWAPVLRGDRDGAKIKGYSTPMEVYNGHYFLTLEGIIIGEKRLMIDAQIFKRNPSSGSGGVVIDSGATYTFLVKAGYKSLKAGVSELIFGLLREVVDPNHPNQLCYNGTVSRDLQTFPSVTFQFARGADLVLEITSMFHQTADDILCLAALETPISNLNIIGIMAQQSYNVAYDLKEMEVSFQRIECELLED